MDSERRSHQALAAVNNIVHETGAKNVWLVGHSLGSAIALLVGKKMARASFPLETYVFNPPFMSLSERNLKTNYHILKSVLKACIAGILKGGDEDDQFRKLCTWIPKLFVNVDDFICSALFYSFSLFWMQQFCFYYFGCIK